MANYSADLDGIYRALGDPTRRAVIHQLAAAPATVTELAGPFDMALPSFMKHLKVLEDCGLIVSSKEGRVRTCKLKAETLAAAESWLAIQLRFWEQHADRLADYVEQLNLEENS